MNTKHQALYPLSEHTENQWNPRKIIAWDTEAYDWTELLALGAKHPNGYEQWTIEDCDPARAFVDWFISRPFRGFRAIAHNLEYDISHIYQVLTAKLNERNENAPGNWEMSMIESGNDIIYVKIQQTVTDDEGNTVRTNCWHIQDSMALLPRALDDMMNAFSKFDGKQDFDYNDLAPVQEMKEAGTWEDMLSYLKRDCEGTEQIVKGFVGALSDAVHCEGEISNAHPVDLYERYEESGELVSPNLTIASTAMEIFRRYFQTDPIRGCSAEAEAAFREAYHGGRTEVFRQKMESGTEGKYYDYNSLYPFVYGTKQHPTGKVQRQTFLPSKNSTIKQLVDMGKGGAVRCEIRVPETTEIPVLPVKEDVDGSEKTLFRTGTLEGCWTVREIAAAIEYNNAEIVEISEAFVADLGNDFEDFTNAFYALKQSIDSKENPGKYNAVKLILNSFWGKFGMGRAQENIVVKPAGSMPPNGAIPLGNSYDEQVANTAAGIFKIPEEAEANYILPRVAASVTAQARLVLYDGFEAVREKGGKVWYCDTDSIVTNVELPSLEGEALGELDLEHEVYGGAFVAPKTYGFESESGPVMKAKGIPQGSDKKYELTLEDYEKALEGNTKEVEWVTPDTGKGTMKAGGFETKTLTRSLPNGDDKRNHTEDGKDSTPLHR